jgi:mRNA interferase MazF
MVARPALVVSARGVGANASLAWVLMITNAVREAWPGDILIDDSLALGLIIPSKVRVAKISSVEIGTATRLGRVSARTLAEVRAELAATLGFNPPAE